VGAQKKKNVYINKNFCVYFTHLPRSPPWRNLHKILHDGFPPRRNQPCRILSQLGQGFWFCGGSNFWIPHKKEKSPLTQGLNYRSACDHGWQKTMLQQSARLHSNCWMSCITLFGKPISELRSVTCRMGSHSVTGHLTQVNVPHLNPSQIDQYSIYLPRRDGRLSWPWFGHILGWFTCPQTDTDSTWPKVETNNLAILSLTPHCYDSRSYWTDWES